ncbi:MAG: hypothetical protein QNK03_05055 [Myxococcota bacterium]|nr:hypothetical protein [Myxococcota bacterium]
MSPIVAWAGLAVALSPAAVELATFWLHTPWARGSALLAPLVGACLVGDRAEPGRRRAAGWLALGAGLALELVAFGGGVERFGRPGIPLAILGLAALLGGPRPVRALASAWLVPMPTWLVRNVGPLLSDPVLAGAEALGGGPGALSGALTEGRRELLVAPADVGLQLVWLGAGLGWLSAALRDAPLAGALRRAAAGAAAGLALQVVLLLAAAGLVALGAERVAAAALHQAGTPLALLGGAAVAWRHHASKKPS